MSTYKRRDRILLIAGLALVVLVFVLSFAMSESSFKILIVIAQLAISMLVIIYSVSRRTSVPNSRPSVLNADSPDHNSDGDKVEAYFPASSTYLDGSSTVELAPLERASEGPGAIFVQADKQMSDAERLALSLSDATRYLEVARDAEKHYKQGGDNVLAALRLFDSEWTHIRDGQAWSAGNAATNDQAARLANAYPDSAADILSFRLPPRERARWYETALVAARKLADKRLESHHLGNLGIAHVEIGEVDKAIEYCEKALAIARLIGDRGAEGNHLNNLGIAYAATGDAHKAIEYYEQALAIAHELRDRRSEGNRLGNLGNAYADLGEIRKAIEYHEQALAVARATGNRRGTSNHLGAIANDYSSLRDEPDGSFNLSPTIDRADKMIKNHGQALAIAREMGDKHGESNHLGNLGTAHFDPDDAREAIEYYDQALAVAREIDDRRSQAHLLGNLGVTSYVRRATRKAMECHEQALALAREIGDRRRQVICLLHLGDAYVKLRQKEEGHVCYLEALDLTRAIRDKILEEETLRALNQVESIYRQSVL